MPPLSIGDRVTDLAGKTEGKIVEIDGAKAYVVQANGVEIEFALDRLKPYAPPDPKTVRTLQGAQRDRALSPAQQRLLESVPAELRSAVAGSYDGATDAGSRPMFAELPDDKKLETIRIYLPTLPQRLLARHIKLVVAFRDLAKPVR